MPAVESILFAGVETLSLRQLDELNKRKRSINPTLQQVSK